MHPLHIVCPACQAPAGHACTAPGFTGMPVEHQARREAVQR